MPIISVGKSKWYQAGPIIILICFHFYIHSLIFIIIQGEEDKFEPLNQSLTFGDLRKSIAAVGREAAQSKFTRHQLRNSSEGVTLGNGPISKTFIFF